ncbi:MAG TPA: ATP-dependent Clp protease proteolytic subunit, partial [Trebonia sp.]|nr:ATP-dependent Clp protease proteolytic subunit [Trebonia sp.]
MEDELPVLPGFGETANPNGRGILPPGPFPLAAEAGDFPWPGFPGPEFPEPGEPGKFPRPGEPAPGGPRPDAVPPSRVWLDPHAGWQDKLYERLLEQRIVLASGVLDEPATSRLSAQLLALDAEGSGPIRLELQNAQADLSAALTLMGVLDVVRAEIQAYAGGETGGPALGVLASCPRRLAYPNATFTLSEPRMRLRGTVTAVTAHEQQARRMTDSLFYRIAEATGQAADDIRADARSGRTFTVAEAIG